MSDKSKLIDINGLKTFKDNYDTEIDEKIAGAGTSVTKESIEAALGYTPANTNNIPTNVSSLTNDAGYLTEFTEEDPTVPTYIKNITPSEISNWNSAKIHADSTHAPSNAQSNVIETIKVNGTALTPNSKAVDITVPTKVSQLTNDSGYKTTDNNTTYSLSKSGSTITLTGSDGSTSSVTDDSGTSGSSVSFTRKLTSGTKVGTLTIDGTSTDLYAPTNTDTHYTTGLKVGASATATSNAAATNGNVYMNVMDNTTVRDSHKIVGSGATTVTSDANGVITISSTDTNTTYGVVSTSANGLCPKRSGTTTKFLRDDGTWAVPTASGIGQTISSSEPSGQSVGDHWLKEF